MKRLGLLGGMSWESSAHYYRLINEAVRDRLGGLHSADLVLRSIDFAEIEEMQRRGQWRGAGERLALEAGLLQAAGAELLVLCTNTLHKVVDTITARVDIPLLHIADASAEVLRAEGLHTVGLLGSAYTMEQDFYSGRLRDQHGLTVLIPDDDDRRIVNDIIFQELCLGVMKQESRDAYRRVVTALVQRGAEGVLLGCTEIGLLLRPGDMDVALFDTARLHAERAVALALEVPAGVARPAST
ncbi:MAG: aspartate/glutamate racemase family protein [Solirubrobacteraceae bacterium]